MLSLDLSFALLSTSVKTLTFNRKKDSPQKSRPLYCWWLSPSDCQRLSQPPRVRFGNVQYHAAKQQPSELPTPWWRVIRFQQRDWMQLSRTGRLNWKQVLETLRFNSSVFIGFIRPSKRPLLPFFCSLEHTNMNVVRVTRVALLFL